MICFDKILGEGGPIAEVLENFEPRPEQVEMANAAAKALEKAQHFAVEAGTGVGKSFAYLVPAIDRVVNGKGKVVISTYTITLQEQLINKDIPFLADCLPYDFDACLAKGRNNYLCMRRLDYAVRKNAGLFDELGKQLSDIHQWATTTKDGSLSDWRSQPSPLAWDAVRSEHGNCNARNCPHYKECFYWRARRRLERADIIVANHALLFSDLVLKQRSPQGVLPGYKFVIIDEAHNIEAVAEGHFGINISNYSFSFLLNGLYGSRTKKGLLAFTDATEAIEKVKVCRDAARVFFRQIGAWFGTAAKGKDCRCPQNVVYDNITEPLKQLRAALSLHLKTVENEDEELEFQRAINKIGEIEKEVAAFLEQSYENHIYWVEIANRRRAATRLRSAPVNVADNIKEVLFDKYEPVILTSATLNCGAGNEKGGFDFFASRVGLKDYQSLQLGSPYDYEKQVQLCIESKMPEPNCAEFVPAAAEAIKKSLTQTGGKAFVLFTSYSMLKEMAEILQGWFDEQGIQLLQQGAGVDRSALLAEFKADTNSVLFGTDSFWQGVDVPGDSLSCVIITKLPFAVPNQPLIAGKIEKIREEGGNPFSEFQLPSAIIKFKQGFGRLIRSKVDTGIVVVLDSRVVNKRYGPAFLQAIPKCKRG